MMPPSINLKKATIILLLSTILIFYCNNWDITAPGPQPHNLENAEHQPKLNVLGILRPDSSDGLPLSFVHVEFSYPINDVPDSSIVPDAVVKILKIETTSPVDTTVFIYTDFGVLPTKEYRNSSFFPEQGTYQLICQKEGYPTIRAQTTIPAVPRIEEASLKLEENKLSFVILRDEQVGLYEVVLQGKDWLVKDRFLRPKQGNTLIEFPLQDIPKEKFVIKIYAFDINLSEYFTVNLSIKPNIYQKEFSTVENGYGCFGAVNILEMKVNF